MRNRLPFLKGESTESANPFGEEDEDDAIPEDGEAHGGGLGGRKKAVGALAEEDIEEGEEDDEDKNEFDLPEWLAELPDDLEVSLAMTLFVSTGRGIRLFLRLPRKILWQLRFMPTWLPPLGLSQ